MPVANNEKKNILFFIERMSGGGAERVILDIINNLDRSKYIPALATFMKQGPYTNLLKDDINVYELPLHSGHMNTLFFPKELRKLIKLVQPDLVVSHVLGSNLSILRAMYILNNINNIPIIICEHNNIIFKSSSTIDSLIKSIVHYEIKFLYRKASKIIVVSHGIKQSLVKSYKLSENDIIVIHNPVDIGNISAMLNKTNDKRLNSHKKNIVAVGRLTEQKGFHDLIRAFALVHNAFPAKLTILGEGELRPQLETLINDLKLHACIELPGFVNDPWSIIHASDLLVLSSYWEGFSLVLLEAMVCGTPVIATDCDYGPREILTQGQDGILVPVGNVQTMSEAIIKVLGNSALRQKFVANSQQKVKQFDLKIATKKYEKLFEDVLA